MSVATGAAIDPDSWTARVLKLLTLGLVGFWLLPSIGLLVTSFRTSDAAQQTGWWTTIKDPAFTFDNYREVLGDGGLGSALLNSVVIAVPSTVLPLAIATFAGYSFSWLRFRNSELVFAMAVAAMVVPVQMALVPLLSAFARGVHLGDTQILPGIDSSLLRLWLVNTAYGLPLATYLMRNYISSLPGEIIAAAKVDGADALQIFYRVVLPLTKPALASFAIFQFLFVYNDFLVAAIFVGLDTEVAPITVALADMVGSRGENAHLLTAGAWVAIVLPLTVFFAFQKQFVSGLTAGAVK